MKKKVEKFSYNKSKWKFHTFFLAVNLTNMSKTFCKLSDNTFKKKAVKVASYIFTVGLKLQIFYL